MTYTLDLNNTITNDKGVGSATWMTSSSENAITSSVASSGGDHGSWSFNRFVTTGDVPNNLGYEVGVSIHHCPSSDSYRNAGIVFNYIDENNYEVAFLRFGRGIWTIEKVVNGVQNRDNSLQIIKSQIGGVEGEAGVGDISFNTFSGSKVVTATIPGHGMQIGDNISFYSGRGCNTGTIDVNGIGIGAGDAMTVTEIVDENTVRFNGATNATSGGDVTTCAGSGCGYFIEQNVALLFEKTFDSQGTHNGFNKNMYWLKNGDNTLLLSEHLASTNLQLGSGHLGLTTNNANARFREVEVSEAKYNEIIGNVADADAISFNVGDSFSVAEINTVLGRDDSSYTVVSAPVRSDTQGAFRTPDGYVANTDVISGTDVLTYVPVGTETMGTLTVSDGTNDYELTYNTANDTIRYERPETFAESSDLMDATDRISETEGDISTLETDVAAHGTRLDTVETDVAARATSAEVTTLAGRVTTAEADVDAVETDVAAHGARLDAVETDVAARATSADVTALGNRVTAAEGTVTSLQSTVAGKANTADVTALAGRVTTSEGNITTLQADVNARTADLTALTGRVTTNEGNISAIQTDLGNKASTTALQAVDARVSVAESGITALQADVATRATSADLTTATARVNTNENDIAVLQSDLAGKASASDVTALDARVATAESGVTALQSTVATKANASDVTALDTRVAVAESGINTLQSTVATKASASDVSALTGRVTTNEGAITTLQTNLTTKASASDVTALTGRVANNEGAITTLQSGLATKANASDVTALTGRVANNEGAITTLQSGLATKANASDVTALTGRTSDVEASVGTINSTLGSLQSTVTTLQATFTSFKGAACDFYCDTKALLANDGSDDTLLKWHSDHSNVGHFLDASDDWATLNTATMEATCTC